MREKLKWVSHKFFSNLEANSILVQYRGMKQVIEPAANEAVKNQNGKKSGEPSPIAWHPAFVEALQLELEAYRDFLEFHPEYQLTSEPLRIDCLVIKKPPDLVIEKNIAAIFREANLVEYKSPNDYISVYDFYKVYGYACLYASIEKFPVTHMTISFIESCYPRELLAHLQEIRGYKVEETSPGIYTVKDDIFPIQIIDSRELSAKENLWLRDLDNKLEAQEAGRLLLEVNKQGKTARLSAYIDAIARANYFAIKEAINMGETVTCLEDVLIETGIMARAEARGEARGEERRALAIAENLVNIGLPPETITAATRLDPEKVKALYKK